MRTAVLIYFSDELLIEGSSGRLACAGYYTEPFSQDGQNGGDYVIVVSDAEIENNAKMRPYYTELVVDIAGEAPDGLKNEIDAVTMEFDGDNSCIGSDMVMVWAYDNL